MTKEVGPVYGIDLVETLKLSGGMMQAMPSREDLRRVQGLSTRTVAGYEVLLAKFYELRNALKQCIDWIEVDERTHGRTFGCGDAARKAIESSEPIQ